MGIYSYSHDVDRQQQHSEWRGNVKKSGGRKGSVTKPQHVDKLHVSLTVLPFLPKDLENPQGESRAAALAQMTEINVCDSV